MKKTVIMLFTLTALVACNGGKKVPAIDTANLDPEVNPAENFYQYATGGWQKNNPLKPEYARYGSFDALDENNVNRINGLFTELGKQRHEPGSVGQKISDLYALGLDSLRLNEEGAAPLKPYLEDIQAITDAKSLARATARILYNGDGPFFGIYAMADLTDSDTNVEYITQSGLGMGDRDYYLDAENAALKAGYKDYLVKVLTLAGVDDPEKTASDALEVEDNIAKVSWSRVEQRDIHKSYNPTSYDELVKTYPNLHFDELHAAVGIAPQEKIIVCEPSYLKGLDAYVKKAPLEKLKNYLTAIVVDGAANVLSDDFYDASFDFYSKQMSGVQEQKPRWKRSQGRVNGLLGEAVGELYVAKYFPEKDKERMLTLVGNIKNALGEHIDSLDWMTDATKAKAREKLDNFHVKIGYPDKWKDYSSLTIDPSLSYYENIVRAHNWIADDNLSKLGKPVDKEEWQMSPQTVNAYYDPTTNEICFPAAILQPPFYNTDADDAVNYGAIGVVIGHEMTHGFDDQGRNFDKDGNLVDWWTPEDAEAFKAKADKLTEQFNEVEVLPGVHANGALTLGENIADLGGLRIAYTALQNALGDSRPGLKDGFTPEQRFYLGFATVWAQNITDEAIARQTKMDEHSLGNNRVNVPIRNLDTFFDAFGIKEGDKMYRPEEERVVIW